VWGRVGTDGPLGASRHRLHPDVRALGAPISFAICSLALSSSFNLFFAYLSFEVLSHD